MRTIFYELSKKKNKDSTLTFDVTSEKTMELKPTNQHRQISKHI